VAVQRAGVAYDAYWQSEVVPVLSSGFRPPIAAGLTQFLSAESISKSLGEHIEQELSGGTADPYDSHPPLRERIEALRQLDNGSTPGPPQIASSLLRNVDRLEHELLLSFGVDPALVKNLSRIQWEETGSRVFLPIWQKQVEENAPALREVRVSALPDVLAMLPKFSARLQIKDVPPEEHAVAAQGILGSALAVRLNREGWSVDARPGLPVTMIKDGRTIEPFAVPGKLANGELTAQAWAEECVRAGVGEKFLA
jgi:hypothetical protein